jgi:hypothetical protein
VDQEPPNNPLKLPVLVVCLILGFALAIAGLLAGNPVYLVVGGGAQLLSWFGIREIQRGRNPSWLRSPLDRRRDR